MTSRARDTHRQLDRAYAESEAGMVAALDRVTFTVLANGGRTRP